MQCKICNKRVTYLLMHFVKKPNCKAKYTIDEIKLLEADSKEKERAYQANYNSKRRPDYDPAQRKKKYQSRKEGKNTKSKTRPKASLSNEFNLHNKELIHKSCLSKGENENSKSMSTHTIDLRKEYINKVMLKIKIIDTLKAMLNSLNNFSLPSKDIDIAEMTMQFEALREKQNDIIAKIRLYKDPCHI